MSYTAYTLAQLQTLMAQRWESTPFWTAEEARIAINEALSMWNLLTGYWHKTITIQTAANTVDYALPSTLLYRTRIKWNTYPLHPAGAVGMDYAQPRWPVETTTTGGSVPTRPIMWAPISLWLIHIWPADAVAHNVLTVEGVAATPVLSAAGDFLDLGDELLGHLLGMALHIASFKRGNPWFAATKPGYTAFLEAAGEQNDRIRLSTAYRKYLGLDLRKLRPLQSDGASQ